jgi:DNA gyrase subunit A
MGIANITLSKRNGTAVAASFAVRPGDDVMLMTDAGRLIRVPGDQVRITGRQAMGVMLLRLNADERVTSVFPVLEEATTEDDPDEDASGTDPNAPPQAGKGTEDDTNG